jgi:hypothetical protein
MTRLLISLLFAISLFSSSSAQVKNATGNLKQQAAAMGKAFMNKDFKGFTKYTYPGLVQLVGGPDKMAAILSKSVSDMNTKGMTFTSVSFDEPSSLVREGNELQSTIPQHTEVKLTNGRAISTSLLVAISKDNGLTWTFVDCSHKDMASVRALLPNLSKSIVIPPTQPAVHYNN